jgi:hypothetical protein
MRQDLQPGNRFPEMELPDHAGNRRRLSELGWTPAGCFCPTPNGATWRRWACWRPPTRSTGRMCRPCSRCSGPDHPHVYNGYWYWGRPSMEELRRDLREITRSIRPDWEVPAA